MSISPGARFGPYQVIEPIGSGGMGEVYRARDTTLGRDVAIKVLPASFSSDAMRVARFEQEAKTLASLNHANIAHIYGLERSDGNTGIVMELVDGQTLVDRIAEAPIPVAEALRIANQIADALEAAHERAIVHRDLKPDGMVKVLDFGIAKALDPRFLTGPGPAALTTPAMTEAGFILGTAAYMSPEQARGKFVDQRTDIWAFGCVLFEMLTGKPAFLGEDVTSTLAQVLEVGANLGALPTGVPPAVRRTLELCLEKDARKRIADMRDVKLALAGTFATGAPVPPISRLKVAVAVGAAVLLAGGAGWLLRPAPAPEPGPVVRFSVPLPNDQAVPAAASPLLPQVAISPDGMRIAYFANGQLYLRHLNESEARPVPVTAKGSINANWPAFSPDGQWLAYVEVSEGITQFLVKRLPITGGTPVTIQESRLPNFPQGLTWPTPDSILFVNASGIVRVPTNGGAPEVLVPLAEGENILSPQLLPGGRAVLFTRLAVVDRRPDRLTPDMLDAAQIVVQSIGSGERKVVWQGGAAAHYVPTGHLVYAQRATLFGIAFDPVARAVRGGPVPVVEGLRRGLNSIDTASFAVSATGTLAMVPGDPNGSVAASRVATTLTWVDRMGHEAPLPVRPDDYTSVRISPDGTKVAPVVSARILRTTPPAIWIFDQRTENLSLLTADAAGDDGPVWSRDSGRIYFRSGRGGESLAVYSIELDTGETKLVAPKSPDHPGPLPWTIAPNDRALGLVDGASLSDLNISALSLPDGKFTSLLNDPAISETQPAFSPNGEWLAYMDALTPFDGEAEISIRPLPAVTRTRVPVGHGGAPVFSHDGSELFYVAGTSLMAVPVTYEPTLRVGAPRKLFDSRAYLWGVLGRAFDVDPTGQRFLMIREPAVADAGAQPPNDRIDVVVNWFEELKQRVRPSGK